MSQINRMPFCFTCLAAVSLLLHGCGAPERKFTPAVESARDALETSLEKWKEGGPHAVIEDFKVPINFIDARWQGGKKLESFEVLAEEKTATIAKIFSVKMKLAEDKEEKEVKYYIVGIDPLNIYREEDYNRASGL